MRGLFDFIDTEILKNYKTMMDKELEHVILDGSKAEILQILEQRPNFKLKTVNESGDTVIHLLIRKTFFDGIIEILQILLDRGINPNVRNKNQKTPLHLVLKQWHKFKREIIDLLLKNNAKIDFCDNQGNTIAHYCIENLSTQLRFTTSRDVFREERMKLEEDSADFIEWLMERDFDFNRKNKNGQSALHLAIELNLQHILPCLLKHTRDINFVSKTDKQNLLQLFLKSKINWDRGFNDLAVDRMLQKGGWVLTDDVFRLQISSGPKQHVNRHGQRYDVKIVEILMERGVNVEHQDIHGRTAVHLAVDAASSSKDVAFIDMIFSRFTRFRDECGRSLLYTLMLNATMKEEKCGDIYSKMFSTLVTKGVEVASKKNRLTSFSAVYHAVKTQNWIAIDFMMNNRVNFKVLTDEAENLFHALARSKPISDKDTDYEEKKRLQEKLLDFLVSKGCDIDAKNSAGQTPLHVAINNVGILRLLLQRKANVNVKDLQGNTALVSILDQGQTTCHTVGSFQELLAFGADINDLNAMLQEYGRRRECIPFEYYVIDHWIKLKAANWTSSKQYEYYDKRMRNNFRKLHKIHEGEVEMLKKTELDSCTSLYQWLHMPPYRRYYFQIRNEKLKALIESPTLAKTFPKLSTVILARYHEAEAWMRLLQPAKKAWIKLTGIYYLPDNCLESILGHLNASVLFGMLKTTDHQRKDSYDFLIDKINTNFLMNVYGEYKNFVLQSLYQGWTYLQANYVN